MPRPLRQVRPTPLSSPVTCMGTQPPLPTCRTLVFCPAPRALARPGASRGVPHRRQAPGSVWGHDSWSLLVEGNMSRGRKSSHPSGHNIFRPNLPDFSRLLLSHYSLFQYHRICSNTCLHTGQSATATAAHEPALPQATRFSLACTGRNLINHIPPKGLISYLFYQTLPGTHYRTPKIFSHFAL